jgi:hypothetical protein
VPRCAEAVRRSAEDNACYPRAGRNAKRPLTERGEKREEGIGSAARRTETERGEARKVLWTAVSCGSRDQAAL